MSIWEIIFLQPLVNALLFLYNIFFQNLGLAIIALTVAIKLILVPITLPSMRSMQKMKDLAPELEKIKKRHKDDKTKLMQAQADLYKQHGINPAAGCLPQIVQLVSLIALFQVFMRVVPAGDAIDQINRLAYDSLKVTQHLNTHFLSLDLTKPDVIHIQGLPFPLPGPFLFVAAALQFLSSKMMMPEAKKAEKAADKTPGQTDDFATAMQSQMLYMFPVLTLFIGVSFASGLVLYWTALSLVQSVQQYFTSGWGGLGPWLRKVNLIS